MSARLARIVLRVSSVAKERTVFTKGLGMRVLDDDDRDDFATLEDSSGMQFLLVKAPPNTKDVSNSLFEFDVSEHRFDATLYASIAAGAELQGAVEFPVDEQSGRTAMLKTTDGYRLGLCEYLS